MIDTAAFFLVLDDFDHEIDHMEPSTLAVNGKVSAVQGLLHSRMRMACVRYDVDIGWPKWITHRKYRFLYFERSTKYVGNTSFVSDVDEEA